jgi:hypothetical protein
MAAAENFNRMIEILLGNALHYFFTFLLYKSFETITALPEPA